MLVVVIVFVIGIVIVIVFVIAVVVYEEYVLYGNDGVVRMWYNGTRGHVDCF